MNRAIEVTPGKFLNPARVLFVEKHDPTSCSHRNCSATTEITLDVVDSEGSLLRILSPVFSLGQLLEVIAR